MLLGSMDNQKFVRVSENELLLYSHLSIETRWWILHEVFWVFTTNYHLFSTYLISCFNFVLFVFAVFANICETHLLFIM